MIGVQYSVISGICALVATSLAADPSVTRRLAVELAREGDHMAAALEFRRHALELPAGDARATAYWIAAHEYALIKEHALAAKMLDRAEDESDAVSEAALLLRGKLELEREDYNSAVFYLDSVLATARDESPRLAAERWLALSHMQRPYDATAAVLQRSAEANAKGLGALEHYRNGRDKRPWLGGVLGIVPGLGYAYAGEYGNALRSLILNSLFIFAMVDTANDEEWGAFTAVTFFELTWYTGSIYIASTPATATTASACAAA